MKSIYTLIILLFIALLPGCSKDFLKNYETRIIDTWKITDVNRIGFGGNTSNLSFTGGTFTFFANGSLTYISPANVTFKGNWEIVKKYRDDETLHSLQITAVDFTNQQVLGEYYDDIYFTSSNHFKATLNSGLRSYVTHFRK